MKLLIIVAIMFVVGCSNNPTSVVSGDNVRIEEGVVACGDLPHVLQFSSDFGALSGSIQMVNGDTMWINSTASWNYDEATVTLNQLTCGMKYRITLYR